jgi:Lrp/AsnC family transcriptional regulator, regulator for asnA, asnC and gidA
MRQSVKKTKRAPKTQAPPERRRRAGAEELDQIDERIIAAMRADGRISNRDLAKIVGVNEATVRTRVRKLEQSKTIRVVALRDLKALGFGHMSAVGVQVKGRSVIEVGEDLARIPQVMTVNATIGAYDIELQVVARDIEEMAHLLTEEVSKVRGVARIAPSLALKVLKYESQWAPIP